MYFLDFFMSHSDTVPKEKQCNRNHIYYYKRKGPKMLERTFHFYTNFSTQFKLKNFAFTKFVSFLKHRLFHNWIVQFAS